MTTHSPLALLAALGLLCHAGTALAQAVDTSQWKCESCPFPKGIGGSIEAGVIGATGAKPSSGDFTGIDRNGGYLSLGGEMRWRSEEGGGWADVSAADLGLDTRSITARGGQEGKYALRLDYNELPRWYGNGDGMSPFLGIGSGTLTLPAGYPAATTGLMPLAATLQTVSPGIKKKNLSLAGNVLAIDDWTLRVRLTRDTREGTRPIYGSFFSTASQLLAPVDQTTDTLEVSAAYVSRAFQGSIGYQVSRFDNAVDALTWQNPFSPVAGATTGQLALAPDTRLHQIIGSGGWQALPWLRVSGDVAFGRLEQDQAFLALTTNAALLPAVGALPAASLDGRVRTFNANVKASATPWRDWRFNAAWARNVRDNETPVRSFTIVATDLFVNGGTRTTTPFDVTQDHYKFDADYRGIESVKLAAGVDQDYKRRPYTEVVRTRETTVWGRATVQARENLGLQLKLSHAQRNNSPYGTAIWFDSSENVLLRKYDIADRRRDTVGARVDWAVSETVAVGFSGDVANDDYNESAIGLTKSRSHSLGADVSTTIAERTQLTAWAQSETMKSDQAGSAAVLYPDWWARNKDRFDTLGLSVKHTLVADKFTVGADLSLSRSRSDLAVDTVVGEPPFPRAKVSNDSVKLYANYKLSDKLWLNGSLWHQRYASSDWRYDGIYPSTVSNLLALGLQPPRYTLDVLSVTVRYSF